jgi:hypothetical protein
MNDLEPLESFAVGRGTGAGAGVGGEGMPGGRAVAAWLDEGLPGRTDHLIGAQLEAAGSWNPR